MRSRDWSKGLSERLQDLNYAGDFILALIDEGESLQEALGQTIRSYGVREFSSLVELNESAVQRAIDPDHNPTKSTLEKLLTPFSLNLGAHKSDGAA